MQAAGAQQKYNVLRIASVFMHILKTMIDHLCPKWDADGVPPASPAVPIVLSLQISVDLCHIHVGSEQEL